jgi:Luciferase
VKASQRITEAVGSWDGVTMAPHRFGGVEFKYGRVELGHIHGDSLADLPFPRAIRDALVSEGRAEPHHVMPQSGWVSKRITDEIDVEAVIELFRMNHKRISTRRGSERRPPYR